MILQHNLKRLGRLLQDIGGWRTAVVGQAGAGKSSLLAALTNGRLQPAPKIGVQTDATNWSGDTGCPLIGLDQDQVWVDTPGYDTREHPTNVLLNEFPWNGLDAFVFVVSGKIRAVDRDVYTHLSRLGQPTTVCRTFSESLSPELQGRVREDINYRLSRGSEEDVYCVSSKRLCGFERLIATLELKRREWIRNGLDRSASGPLKSGGPTCPLCGFSYAWSGSWCGHCRAGF